MIPSRREELRKFIFGLIPELALAVTMVSIGVLLIRGLDPYSLQLWLVVIVGVFVVALGVMGDWKRMPGRVLWPAMFLAGLIYIVALVPSIEGLGIPIAYVPSARGLAFSYATGILLALFVAAAGGVAGLYKAAKAHQVHAPGTIADLMNWIRPVTYFVVGSLSTFALAWSALNLYFQIESLESLLKLAINELDGYVLGLRIALPVMSVMAIWFLLMTEIGERKAEVIGIQYAFFLVVLLVLWGFVVLETRNLWTSVLNLFATLMTGGYVWKKGGEVVISNPRWLWLASFVLLVLTAYALLVSLDPGWAPLSVLGVSVLLLILLVSRWLIERSFEEKAG